VAALYFSSPYLIQLDVEIKAQKTNFLGAVSQNDQSSVVFMRVAVGSLAVTPSKRMEKDMERTTKKKPPSKSDIQIIYSNYDEFEGSDGKSKKNPVFENLILGPSAQGKIFIGFPTHQTTGCSIHVFFLSHYLLKS
jgi:hypothetical protein